MINKKKYQSVVGLISFSAIFISIPCLSATDELIVTGSYSPVRDEQLTSSVSVINREELMQLSSRSLVDALRQVPSIWVEEQGGSGGITGISLRGAESNHTLVLLDGVQLNDPTNTRGGAFDINSINIESVERIEIIRGAQSSIYGSDALAGVIQIFTTEVSKNLTQINSSLGGDGYKTIGVTKSGASESFGYAFTAQTKNSGEPVVNHVESGSTAKNNEVIGKLNWKSNQHQIDFNYRYFDGERTAFPEQSGGPLFAVIRDQDKSEFTDQSSALALQTQINEFWKSKLEATWYKREEVVNSPGIFPFDAVPANGATTDFSRKTFSWVNTVGDQKTVWSNLGVDTKQEEGISEGYLDFGFKFPTNFKLNRRINSAFVNLNGYAIDDLLLQASVRHNSASKIKAKTSLQLGARYQINSKLHWFANWGEGFKLPSFFALGHPLVGNPDLKPETAVTRDTGFEWRQKNYSFGFSYFDHNYSDLIDFDSQSFKNVNRSRVETSGVETEFNWQPSAALNIRMHATYTDIDMMTTDSHLLGRPQVKAGSSINYLLNNQWKINVNYLWVDKRFAVSRYTGIDMEQTLAAYDRFDAIVVWQINPKIRTSLNLENLANESYESDIGFPAMGRRALFSLVVGF